MINFFDNSKITNMYNINIISTCNPIWHKEISKEINRILMDYSDSHLSLIQAIYAQDNNPTCKNPTCENNITATLTLFLKWDSPEYPTEEIIDLVEYKNTENITETSFLPLGPGLVKVDIVYSWRANIEEYSNNK